MIQEKVKSLNDNVKQKEGEGSKVGEFNTSKGRFDNFRKNFGLNNVKATGETASADQKAANKFPDAIKEIPEEKRVSLNRCYRRKCPLAGKKSQRTFIRKEEK